MADEHVMLCNSAHLHGDESEGKLQYNFQHLADHKGDKITLTIVASIGKYNVGQRFAVTAIPVPGKAAAKKDK